MPRRTRTGNLAWDVFHFVGERASGLVALSAFLSALQFLLEVGLGLFLQAFLSTLGIMSGQVTAIPALGRGFPQVAVLGIAILALRACVEGMQSWAGSRALVEFSCLQRKRIASRSLGGVSASSGEFLRLYGDTLDGATGAFYQSLSSVNAVILAIPIAVILLRLSPAVTGCLCALMLVASFPSRAIGRRSMALGKLISSTSRKLYFAIAAALRNFLLLRIYGQTGAQIERAHGMLDEIADLQKRQGLLQSSSNAYVSLSLAIALVTVGSLYNHGIRDFTMNAALYFYLARKLLSLIVGLQGHVPALLFRFHDLRELFEWNRHAPAVAVFSPSNLKNVSRVAPPLSPIGWRIHHLSFGYPDSPHPLFQLVDLEITPGSFTALTGPSGSGKSSLIALLLSQLSPSTGSIEVEWDGRRCEISKAERLLLQSVGYVGSESFLIEGTVAENLRFGLSGPVGESEMLRALAQAHCEFVFEMPEGLGHRLTEQGAGRSSGQKQRLCLARALLRSPRALILDEATANLDEKAEALVLSTLRKLKGKVTIIAATHRASLVAVADRRLDMADLAGPVSKLAVSSGAR